MYLYGRVTLVPQEPGALLVKWEVTEYQVQEDLLVRLVLTENQEYLEVEVGTVLVSIRNCYTSC